MTMWSWVTISAIPVLLRFDKSVTASMPIPSSIEKAPSPVKTMKKTVLSLAGVEDA